MNAKEQQQIRQVLKLKLANVLMDHVGANRAIGMGELYESVFGRPYENRINDTRQLRHLITDLRFEGKDVCSNGQGYYLASASSEMSDYADRTTRRALKSLAMLARQKKISAAELAGQLVLPLQEEMHKLEYERAGDPGVTPGPRIPALGTGGNGKRGSRAGGKR